MFNHLIIIPTQKSCCLHCRENQDSVNMTTEVCKSIKQFLKNLKGKGLFSLFIEFFEGLQRLDMILELSKYAKDLFTDLNNQYVGGLTTKGTLLNIDTFKKLNDVGIRSILIPLELTNLFRRQKSDFTYDSDIAAIRNNLLAIKQSDLPFQIILCAGVTPESEVKTRDFIQKELSFILFDSRFSIHYKLELNMMSVNDNNCDTDKQLSQTNKPVKYAGIYHVEPLHSVAILPNGDLANWFSLDNGVVGRDNGVFGKLLSDGTVALDNFKLPFRPITWLRSAEENVASPRDYLKI